MFTITRILLKRSERYPTWYTRFDEFCNFLTNSESAGHRIKYPELKSQCTYRILRHNRDIQPIKDANLTCAVK